MLHFGKRRIPVVFFILIFPVNYLLAQETHSDNNDGTYTNPVIFADFPDPDVILVADTYYMVSTTMFIFPGVTILKSYDLVNWEYCSNAAPRFDFNPCYNLDGCARYGHGQWATSLKYNNGIFYLMFITLNEGGFICSASKAEGPWEIRKLPKGFYEPGLTIGTARLEVKYMKDGDVAGLAVFQDPYAFIGVKQNKGSKFLVMINNGKAIDSLAIKKSSVYLQTIACNNTKKATFEFSFDNQTFMPPGDELSMIFNLAIFTGNKFCLFNYATNETGGHVDFDWFRTSYQ